MGIEHTYARARTFKIFHTADGTIRWISNIELTTSQDQFDPFDSLENQLQWGPINRNCLKPIPGTEKNIKKAGKAMLSG